MVSILKKMNDDIRYFFKNAENRMFYQKVRGRGELKKVTYYSQLIDMINVLLINED